MKKLILLFGIILLINSVHAVSVGMGLGINGLNTYNCFANEDCDDSNPLTSDICTSPGTDGSYCENNPIDYLEVNMCDHRYVFNQNNEIMRARINNYIFNGESIHWEVFVFNNNGTENLNDIYITVGNNQGLGNTKKVSCIKTSNENTTGTILFSCNVRMFGIQVTQFDSSKMSYYNCTLIIDDTYGENWITVEASNKIGTLSTMPENEFWFLNPVINMSFDPEAINFGVNNNQSHRIFSDLNLIGNNADTNTGVILIQHISGKELYDEISKELNCPGKIMPNISYFASNGAYNTLTDPRADKDGFVPLPVDNGMIIKNNDYITQFRENALSPEAQMAIQFRIDIPNRCYGKLNESYITFNSKEAEYEYADINNQNISLNVPVKLNLKPILNISLISNVSMYNSALNTTINQLVNHRPYIYENDSLSFYGNYKVIFMTL